MTLGAPNFEYECRILGSGTKHVDRQGSQRDHNLLGSVHVAPYVSRQHQTARAVKVIPFPTPPLSEFMAELQREGISTVDLANPAEVEPFREAVRREARRLGVRFRTGFGNAHIRDDQGRETWVYQQRVWACDPTWEHTPGQRFRHLAAWQRWCRMFSDSDRNG